MLDFPTNPGELDLNWLVNATGIASLESFAVEKMTGGFWSHMVRLHLVHSEPDAPSAIIAKFANPSDQARFICTTFRLNQTELGFYQSTAADSPVRCPTCYQAQADTAFTHYVLLMEDFGPSRIDQLSGCCASDAQAVVKALARLHSRWWEHPGLSELEWLCTPAQMTQSLSLVMSMVSERALANLENCPPDISASWPSIMDALPSLLNQLGGQPSTLTHGDVRLMNLFLDRDNVGFVDWQAARHAHGCYDLAYFLTQSLSTTTRREHESHLIKYYQQQLTHNGIDAPSIDELELAYKLCSVYCLVYPIIAASSADAIDNPEALLIAERAFTAVLDSGALELVL